MRIHLSLSSRAATLPAERMVVVAPPAATWPFVYPLTVNWPAGPAALSMSAIHEAFVNHQTAGTRLVTTQALFLFQTWSDAIGDRDVVIVATADRDSLATHAPEILARRGLFSDVVVEDGTTPESGGSVAGAAGAGGAVAQLAAAFRLDDPVERLRLCVSALAEGRTPATLLAAASTCMEVN